jgi:diguanylate cyclase (GGDEF)-like protein
LVVCTLVVCALVVRALVVRPMVVRRLVSHTVCRFTFLLSARIQTALLSAALAVAALCLSLRSVIAASGGVLERSALFVALAVTFFLTEQYLVNVEFRRESHSMTFAGVPLVVGVLMLPVHELVLARLTGSVVALVIQRVSTEKVVYNSAAFSFEAALTATVVDAWHRVGSTLTVSSLAVLLVAVAAGDQLMSLLVLGVIRVHGGQLTRKDVADVLLPAFLLSLIATMLGAAIFELLGARAVGIVLVVAILGLAIVVYRFFAAVKRRHESLETVHEFVTLGDGVESIEDLARERLTHLRRLLRAASASLTLASEATQDHRRQAAPPALYQADINEHDEVAIHPVGEASLDWLQLKALWSAEPTLVPAGTNDLALQRWLRDRHVAEAMVVPILDGTHPVGVITVTDRMGETTTFTEHDLRLLRTLTSHLAVALRNARLLERLIHDATHDALTGLHNRAYLSDRIAEELSSGRDDLAVLLLDLDKFKEVNDVLGHDVGDRLLAIVAERLRSCVPADATIARLGGDEFAILLTGLHEDASSTSLPITVRATELVTRIAQTLNRPVQIDDAVLMPEASIGVAVHDSQHARDLMRCADTAMYVAKASDTAAEIYHPSMDRGRAERLALVADLRLALDEHPEQFSVFYQPKIDLGTDRVVSTEALLRWNHPQLGTVGPDRFIPLAEASGLIQRLTSQVLHQASADCAQWRRHGHDLTVAVNLSARNVADDQLPGRVREILRAAELPADRLILEITESSVMADPERAVPILQRLADDGITLSIDDFGTGYSSLAYLQRLPIQEVKIDRSFVSALDGDNPHSALSLIRSVIALGRNLGLRVVAEGIETTEQRDELERSGCHVGQGYLFSRPLPAQELIAWLDQRHPARRLAIATG